MNDNSVHLIALSALLASDRGTRKLHIRHLQILALACANDGPHSVASLARAAGISSGFNSKVIDRLFDEGLITRTVDPSDRRLLLIAPTKTGRDLNCRVAQYAATRPSPAAA
jgi:DNA-binding MarR family transcriptional regulator